MQVAGVDGCERGWLVVQATIANRLYLASIDVEPAFVNVLKRTRDCDAVAIDIPIGLSDDGRREADTAARKVLSPLRHNSVFPAPIRAVLVARNYREACAISAHARRDGKKVSKQTYFLTAKIADVDHHLSRDLSMQHRVVEVHPEVCFWALNDRRPLEHHKRTREGERERVDLLSSAFADDLRAVSPPPGAARNDLYDACAAAWTARRVAYGTAKRLPPEPLKDARGLRMEIVY